MSFLLRKIVQTLYSRPLMTTPVLSHVCPKEVPASLTKLRRLQAVYQCNDGNPVWLKRGFLDRFLFGSTVIVCYIGCLNVISTIYDNAKPQSWKDADKALESAPKSPAKIPAAKKGAEKPAAP